MRLLLDTHVLIWLLADDPSLGPGARAALSAPEAERFVSVVFLWEIALKAALGKLRADPAEVDAALAPAGLDTLDLARGHELALATLPLRPGHRDPFDRMLLAQAAHEGLTLLAADAKLADYGVPILGCA